MWCPGCRRELPPDAFPLNRSSRTGRQTYCKPCHNQKMRDYADKLYGGHKNFLLQRRYGITEADLNRMIEAQSGLCAICRTQAAKHVDHCHATGKVRGILCFNCNGGLGRFAEDPAVMRRAIEYLVAHGNRR